MNNALKRKIVQMTERAFGSMDAGEAERAAAALRAAGIECDIRHNASVRGGEHRVNVNPRDAWTALRALKS